MRFADAARLSSCVHCGLCLPACPTYLELGEEADSPRGRIYLMRALEEGRLEPTEEVVRHLDLCLGCRACETACPSGVEYGRLIEAARPWIEERRPAIARRWRRALAAVLTNRRLGRLGLQLLRPIAGRRAVGRLARSSRRDSLGRWLGLAAALPPLRPRPLPAVVEPLGPARGTAVLLVGCAPAGIFSETARAAVELLARAGVRVHVPPGQECCGALALHLGAAARARALATKTARTLAAARADWVVTTAAGCGAHVREYAHHAGGATGSAVARSARDVLALLDELGLPPPDRSLERTVAVHDACHLVHGQGVRTAPRRLLGMIPGIRLVELVEADTCCGSAGTYSLTEPTMASRLLARKLDRIVASGADVVAAANPGCILQIRSGAIRRGVDVTVAHPLELLAAAYGDRS